MTLDKAIASKKEHRKPYFGSKAFANSCRNNKGCPHCKENRLYSNMKRLLSTKDQYDAT